MNREQTDRIQGFANGKMCLCVCLHIFLRLSSASDETTRKKKSNSSIYESVTCDVAYHFALCAHCLHGRT